MDKLECTITRNKSGFTKKIYPVYTLTHSQSGKFLLAAQKMNMLRSAHYLITMDSANRNKHSPGYVGKLRSDNSGVEYNLFDTGENPRSVKELERVRNQLAAVYYVVLGDVGRIRLTRTIKCQGRSTC
eukprot:TRINITY_DN2049_c0_g2_i1.p5 TRINITY_DN2049_c0_g2~~TRINITY_DN2049_c0_g2_i1.p5  ORF type:complete len:128 (+),score=36.85 TRINITY_DN2049_c0_g2_i1:878-1261(+)